MAVIQRGFGQRPPLKESMERARQFTDAAMKISPRDILSASRTIDGIPRQMARLTGIRLQLEGDESSKNVVGAAYAAVNNLTVPSFQTEGIARTTALFTSTQTHETLRDLSHEIDSLELEKLTERFRKKGSDLTVDERGLKPADEFVVTRRMKANHGCPYTAGRNAKYFDDFTDHIVETFAQAHRSRMPQGWLGRINR